MKLYLLIALFLSIRTQLNDDIKAGVGINVKNLTDNLNEKVAADIYEEEKTRIMNEFMAEAINNLNDYKNQEKRVIEVGEFEIQVQSTCSLVMPPTPVIHPVELECLTGHLEGELIAKAIVKLSGETPQPGDMVVAHMAECELILEKEVNVNIFNNCFTTEIGSYYDKYFNNLVRRMENQGYRYETDGNGGYTFTRNVTQDGINLDTDRAELVSTVPVPAA